MLVGPQRQRLFGPLWREGSYRETFVDGSFVPSIWALCTSGVSADLRVHVYSIVLRVCQGLSFSAPNTSTTTAVDTREYSRFVSGVCTADTASSRGYVLLIGRWY